MCLGGLAVIDAPWGDRAGPVFAFRAPVQETAKVAVARCYRFAAIRVTLVWLRSDKHCSWQSRLLKRGTAMDTQQRWYVGVDWASQNHYVRIVDSDGRTIAEKIFKHGGEGLNQMADWLMTVSGAESPSQIHIAIEVPHGPVVETLLERGFHVCAINPKQLDRFRDRYTLAGAKDDSRDALVMASGLRTDPRCFHKLEAADPAVVELREWSRITDDLGAERNRLTNRLRQQFWRYFPAFLELDSDLGAEWLLELWEKAPLPAKATRVREATIAKLLKRHRIRRFDAAMCCASCASLP
jgi:transposase